MCDDDDGDPYRVLRSEFVTARKQYLCYACGEPIALKTRHHVEVGTFGGDIDHLRHCLRCWAMMEALWDKGIRSVDPGLCCGELWENPPEHVAALAFLLPGESPAMPKREGVR